MAGIVVRKNEVLNMYSRWLVARAWDGLATKDLIKVICQAEDLPAPRDWTPGTLDYVFKKYGNHGDVGAQLSDIFTLREIESVLRQPSHDEYVTVRSEGDL